MARFQAFEDITGFSPAAERFHAIDPDTYDGAEDAGPQREGFGPTAEAAIADALAREEERA